MYLSRFLRTVVPQNRTQNLLRVSLLKSKAQREGKKTRNYSANWKNFVITCSELVAFSIRGDGTFRTENWAWHHRMTDSSLWHTQAQINRKMMVVSKRWSAPRREISRSWKGFALKISSFRYGIWSPQILYPEIGTIDSCEYELKIDCCENRITWSNFPLRVAHNIS